jgi:hypothetical protein
VLSLKSIYVSPKLKVEKVIYYMRGSPRFIYLSTKKLEYTIILFTRLWRVLVELVKLFVRNNYNNY